MLEEADEDGGVASETPFYSLLGIYNSQISSETTKRSPFPSLYYSHFFPTFVFPYHFEMCCYVRNGCLYGIKKAAVAGRGAEGGGL